MEARYLTDEGGDRVAVILGLQEYQDLQESRKRVEEARASYAKAIEALHEQMEAQREIQRRLADETREMHQRIAEAQKRLAEELERVEEVEDLWLADMALAELERGEDELIPWDQAKREIDEERAELRRRGEL